MRLEGQNYPFYQGACVLQSGLHFSSCTALSRSSNPTEFFVYIKNKSLFGFLVMVLQFQI